MREKGFDSVNVVPFIDIMLVLLTIVLATATFIKTGIIPVELPKTESTESASASVTLDLTAESEFYFNGTLYGFEELKEVLRSLNRGDSITVRADRRAPIEPFARLMGIMREYGFESVNLQTETAGEGG